MRSASSLLMIYMALSSHSVLVFGQGNARSEQPKERAATAFPKSARDTDNLIERLSTADYEAACASLNEWGEAYNHTVGALINNSLFGDGPSYMRGVLSDRRVARVYGFLAALSKQEAAQRAGRLFDDKLQVHVRDWQVGLAANAAGEPKFLPTEPNAHALRSSLFLVACFCDSNTVLQKLDSWRDAMTPIGASMLLNSKTVTLIPYLHQMGLPDNLFVTNIMLHTLRNANKLNPEVTGKAMTLGMAELEVISFVNWNAHTGPYDVHRQLGGASVDKDNELCKVTCARHWNVKRGKRRPHSLLVEEEVTGYLRRLIEGVSIPHSEEPQPTPAVP